MVEKTERVFTLGRIFCSVSVQTSLDNSGIMREELLQFHRHHEDQEANPDKSDWKCTPFELARSGQTIWVITDPQQQSTMLLLEGP